MEMILFKYGYLQITNNEDKIFFISDPHFDHSNIIRLCNRPFNNVHDMNLTLINNWNNTVPEDGLVFILGDFCWGRDHRRWIDLLNKLSGQKILIKGNHDYYKTLEKVESEFVTIRERLELKVNNNSIMLDHYPMKEWNGSFRGVYSLYGHIHDKDFPDAKSQQYNVCVERNDYRPVSYNEVISLLSKQIKDNTSNLQLKDILI